MATDLDAAARAHNDRYGHAATMNTWLGLAFCAVTIYGLWMTYYAHEMADLAVHREKIVVGIDAEGRASVLPYDVLKSKGKPPELRRALVQFAQLYFSRVHATVQREYPKALFFLSDAQVDATIAAEAEGGAVEKVLANPGQDDVTVDVKNVTFLELDATPYRAEIDFYKVYQSAGSFRETRREKYIAQVQFTVLDSIPNTYEQVNPLGVQITQLRVDQAFE